MELTYTPDAEHHGHGHGHEPAPARRSASVPARARIEAPPHGDTLAAAQPVRPDGGSHAVGIGVVVAVHVLIGYALLSGLAQKVVDALHEPVQVHLIEAVKPPPPPEPPRRIVKVAPRLAPPPPAYVPPPQVVVAPTPAPTITAVTQTPPVAPPAPVVVAAPAPAPAPRTEPVAIGLVCPTMVRPTLPRRAEQEGIGGSVRAQATIRGGKVVQVDILSSRPRGLFDASVRAAMLQYGCQSTGAGDVVATQNFEFKADE